ncbi:MULTISPECIES: hypothetical protein [Streptomyces]|uniref:hypothetical protein n=1 Tax=Streptomyces TaxID=1883 RepID=UPI0016730DA8|nr:MULTISPECIES: hypothetical protein [Streptomyces]MBD3578173.1 hypothetical protein [Streptomyces sp. KD18]GGT29027.1 hypothetical protein GCM10010286_62990 [Streptomyces toxytricini]
MIAICAHEMTGGRRSVYVAHLTVEVDDAAARWGTGERFEDEWDLGPRLIYCWRLDSGVCVALNRLEHLDVPGFGFYMRADDEVPAAMRFVLEEFLNGSGIARETVAETAF